ncbi:MAG: M56 family metallopeptidase [Acidobacteriales bacterium]|nr:M56 family metallopeptidase [Terriglobales bacterium]
MNLFAMSPGVAVAFLSTFCGFLLKVSVAYLFCWLLTRIATAATIRFVVWLSYLTLTGAYWIYCVAQVYFNSMAFTIGMTGSMASSSGLTWTLSTSVAQIIGSLLSSIFLIYAGALLVIVCLGGWKRIQLARALSYRTAPPEKLTRTFETIKSEMRVSDCGLWLLPGLTSPATLGWLKPAVYLPFECGGEEQPGLHSVLRHELSHVRRKDSFWESVSRFCRLLVIFHPFVHKAFARLRFERELACDMVVIRTHPEKRHLYADTLVHFGWKTAAAEQRDYIGIGFISQSAILNARVKSILKGERTYSRWSLSGRALLSTCVLWLFAAAVPALWVGFSLTAIPRSVAAAPANLHPIAQIRHPHRISLISRFTPQIKNTANLDRDPLLEPSPSISHAVQYHIQNEDEPMSNPAQEGGGSGVETVENSNSSISPRRSNLPSATSVLTDTAVRLSQMGIGHDHDHDHD